MEAIIIYLFPSPGIGVPLRLSFGIEDDLLHVGFVGSEVNVGSIDSSTDRLADWEFVWWCVSSTTYPGPLWTPQAHLGSSQYHPELFFSTTCGQGTVAPSTQWGCNNGDVTFLSTSLSLHQLPVDLFP